MKLTPIITLCMVAIAFGLSNAQSPIKFTVVGNVTNNIKDKERTIGVVGNVKDGICLIAYDKKNAVCIKKVGANNTIAKTQTLPTELVDIWFNAYDLNGGNANFVDALNKNATTNEGFFQLGNKYYMVGIAKKDLSLMAYEINIKEGKINLPGKNIGKVEKKKSWESVRLFVSGSKQKFWIVGPNPQEDKKPGRTFMAFDVNLKLIKKIVSYEVVNDAFCTDEQDLYSITVVYKDKKKFGFDVRKLNGSTFDKIGGVVYDQSLNYQPKLTAYKGSVIVSGYYSRDEVGVLGVFLYRVLNGKESNITYYPFSENITSLYAEKCKYPAEQKKDYGAHSDNLQIQNLLINMETEEIFVIGQPVYDNYSNEGNYWYQRGSTYLTKLNSDGSLAYNAKVPYNRRNNYEVKRFEMLHKGKVYFMFSDSKDNTNVVALTDKKPVELGVAANGEEVVMVVDEKGEVKRYLSGLPAGAADAFVEDPIKIDDDEYLFYTSAGEVVLVKPQ